MGKKFLKTNNGIINIFIFILLVVSSLIYYFTREIQLLFALSDWWFLLESFVPCFLLFLLLYRLKSNVKWLEDIENRLFVICLVGLPVLILSGKHTKDYDWNYINTTGGIITYGVIDEIQLAEGTGYITIHYKEKNNINKELELSRSLTFAKKLSVGDTVLLLHSLDYKISFFYDKNPTHEKIQRCKNGCYYINGKIVDSLDNQ